MEPAVVPRSSAGLDAAAAGVRGGRRAGRVRRRRRGRRGPVALPVLLLAALLPLRLAGPVDAAELPPFGEAEARALLPAAAAMPRALLDTFVDMGALVQPSDALALGDMPLTLRLLGLALPYVEPEVPVEAGEPAAALRSLQPLEAWSVRELRDALRAAPPGTPAEVAALLPDSLLRPPHLGEVRATQEGARARGTARFRVGDLLAGEVAFAAEHRPGEGWVVDALRFVPQGEGVRRLPGAGSPWFPERRDAADGRWRRVPLAALALEPGRLPRLRRAGPLPLDGVHVALTAGGRLITDGGEAALPDLARRLAAAPRGPSSGPPDLVLHVEAGLPWSVVDLLLRVAQRAEPPRTRVAFAVTVDGSSEVHAVHLVAGFRPLPDPQVLRLEPHAGQAGDRDVLAALEALAGAPGDGVRATGVWLKLLSPRQLAAQHVLRCAGLAFEAGMRQVSFAAWDEEPADAEALATPEALRAHVRASSVRPGGFALHQGETLHVGPPASPPALRGTLPEPFGERGR